ncbi:MAG: hypothetical protein HPY59_13100 [Anaerolineae bacterium]|nr:hypothetical protein [Anaerolineae bacterium]
MKQILAATVLLAIILSSCVSAPPLATATPEPTRPVETPTSPPQPTLPDPTATIENPTTAPPDPAGKVVFKIAPGESEVQYEVGETFLNQNNRFAVAIGVTGQINGEIFADLANPPASTIGPISVDISQFKSDSSRRDNAIRQRFLESERYPIATFIPTEIEGLPASYQEGQDYTFRVTGDLTVRQVTLPVAFDIAARLQDNTLSGTATTNILMSDFGVGPISLAGILQTEDLVKLTFRFVARP